MQLTCSWFLYILVLLYIKIYFHTFLWISAWWWSDDRDMAALCSSKGQSLGTARCWSSTPPKPPKKQVGFELVHHSSSLSIIIHHCSSTYQPVIKRFEICYHLLSIFRFIKLIPRKINLDRSLELHRISESFACLQWSKKQGNPSNVLFHSFTVSVWLALTKHFFQDIIICRTIAAGSSMI